MLHKCCGSTDDGTNRMIMRCVCRDSVLETRGVRTREYIALQEEVVPVAVVCVNVNNNITVTHLYSCSICAPAPLPRVMSLSRQSFYDANIVESCRDWRLMKRLLEKNRQEIVAWSFINSR